MPSYVVPLVVYSKVHYCMQQDVQIVQPNLFMSGIPILGNFPLNLKLYPIFDLIFTFLVF